jgi:hypothetical protein
MAAIKPTIKTITPTIKVANTQKDREILEMKHKELAILET